ncbi:hypothetical protein NEF87_002276 [Candidatus Lokiarchaeum ossiferum]|uniref:Nudix hydrolase domain-containing protein n=1 Tax=Candidatus Lokiarchaeum ossiferum TaxID=2951803 RepID=A0ABY6HTV2_9ARCH|nr:hypothetical protein NEF87_002276 [Candidatus Lokiarchaeum sp. B-35]
MKFDDSELKWKTVEERVVFENKFIRLRNDIASRPDGVNVDFIVVENKSFASVICKTKDHKLPMVRQFRYPWMAASWEIPSGIIDPGELPEDAAVREVEEETGYRVTNLRFLMKFHPFGIAKGWCYLFYADVEEGNGQALDPNEFLQMQLFTPEEIDLLQDEGDLIHASTLVGWNLAKNMKLV